jgi:hypothetical protein
VEISITKENLERFSFLMAFYEHAYYLKRSGVIKRKIVSPDFFSDRALKERLSRIILKGLRSSSGYDIGVDGPNAEFPSKIMDISRNITKSLDIERYMEFLVTYKTSHGSDNIFKKNDGQLQIYPIDDVLIKKTIIAGLFKYRSQVEYDAAYGSNLARFIFDNYEIYATRVILTHRSLVSIGDTFPEFDENVRITVTNRSLPECSSRLIGDPYFVLNGIRMNVHSLINDLFRGTTVGSCHHYYGLWSSNKANFFGGGPLSALEGTELEMFCNKELDGNLFLQITPPYTAGNNLDGGGIVFARKRAVNGETSVVPNMVTVNNTALISFSREYILNPQNFYNSNLNIRNFIMGVTNHDQA